MVHIVVSCGVLHHRGGSNLVQQSIPYNLSVSKIVVFSVAHIMFSCGVLHRGGWSLEQSIRYQRDVLHYLVLGWCQQSSCLVYVLCPELLRSRSGVVSESPWLRWVHQASTSCSQVLNIHMVS